MPDGKSQSDKSKEAASEAECSEDEARWTEQMKKLVQAKPEKPSA